MWGVMEENFWILVGLGVVFWVFWGFFLIIIINFEFFSERSQRSQRSHCGNEFFWYNVGAAARWIAVRWCRYHFQLLNLTRITL